MNVTLWLGFGGGFVPAFVLTWLIETIVYLLAFRTLGWLDPRSKSRLTAARTVLLALLLNLATHPLLWLFVSTTPGIGALLLAETLAVAVEGLIIALIVRDVREDGGRSGHRSLDRWIWAGLAALLANATSLLCGLTLVPGLLRAVGAAGSAACC